MESMKTEMMFDGKISSTVQISDMFEKKDPFLGKTIKIKKPKKVEFQESFNTDALVDDHVKTLKEMIQLETLKESLPKDDSGVLSNLGSYTEEPYEIIESYFRGQHLERLVRHQIESYNHFINYQIQRTIQMFNPVTIRSEHDYIEEHGKYFLEIQVSFENFKLYPPQIHENNGATKMMFPQEAKLRNFTYASTMTVDVNIKYIVRNTESMDNPKIIQRTLPKINIGKMPIMIKSSICVLSQNKNIHPKLTGECNMDCGGYFIIKGSEKTVLGQERAAENRIYCFDGKNTAKWNWFAEIKSVPDYKCISPKQIEMMISSKNNGFGNGLYINIPRIKQPIELFVLFRALGVHSDKKICQYILLDITDEKQAEVLDCLQASVIDANKYPTKEDALRHITAYAAYTPINMDKEKGYLKKQEFTRDVLNSDLFPHCSTMEQKLYLLGYMAKKLIQTSLGWIPTDDRDSYLNKRIELTGTLLNNLFRNYFNKLVKEMQKQVVREINNGSWRSTEDYENIINMTNVYKIMKSTTIENGINRALSTGDFSIKQSNSSKVGVAQVLNRLTYIASLSHLRRINTPLEKSGELIAPRKLHNTTWGFLCLSGDTEVLMSNRSTIKQIKDMKDGDRVNTVNITNLKDEPSDIHSFFSKMPDKLFELTTISGRKIKATANHPFLVNVNGNCQWKNLEDIVANDKIVIRHSIKNMIDKNSTEVRINVLDVLDHYKMELLEANLINTYISTNKLKIIARLIGSLNTDGHLNEIIDGNKLYYSAEFYLGEDSDAFQIADDILELGFGNCSIRRRTTSFDDKNSNRKCIQSTWEVSKGGAFAYLLFLLGGFAGKKTNMKRSIPQWLINAEPSIKREFLSAFQGGDGSRMSYQKNDKNWKPHLGITTQTTYNAYLTDTVSYITQIVDMFGEFGIKSRVKTTKIDDDKTKVCLVFENSSENLVKYADLINYVYCEEKRRTSAPIIEHLKIKEFNKTKRDEQYQYIIDNYGTISTADIAIETGLTKNQVQKVICKNKKGIRQTTRFTTDIIYESYLKENILNNGCISVPILNIKEIEPELVYDFTTRSDNHSFVASSFVTHNCPAETPEGQSIGVVKNISYMGHITIPTNSASLYEYILPTILKVDNTGPDSLHGKTKVFINGCWVGVSESPVELYANLKDKKYRGIINIYTSVVFDYKMMEIRVCNDGGRLTRPVLKVKDGKALLTKDIVSKIVEKELSWNDLLTNCKIDESVIEYIDPEEQNFAMIAMKAKEDYLIPKGAKLNFTHCEIHPSTIFGILGSCIPYPDHNQAPRNTYQCLDPNEIVHMSDGSKKKIGEVQIGESVITFNPETFEQSHTKVVKQFVRENEYPIYKITTESGREITATGDHKFITNIGWATVDQMMNDVTLKIGRFDDILENVNFEKIKSHKKCPNGLISDIEVESENHSFISSNGFLSSNCAMAKQAMGVYAMNYDKRMDKTSYVLSYPSRPLVDTRIMNFLHLNKIPSGSQIHVAIMSHTGYNQEDSVLINKGSIDRGLFMTTIYHTEKDEDKNIIRDEIIRCKPDPVKTKGIKFGNYSKLDSQGFIPENSLVENRDVIIAKIVPIKENRNDPTKTVKYEDQSKIFRTTEETYIDKNYTGRNGDGYNFAKVRVRILRKPVLGDKCSSRHGQKGTMGNIIPECDMPFTKDGIRPDIIINPHAIPSRMTIGQLKETLLGKVLLELGLFGDGTSFGNLEVKTIAAELQKVGYESYGNEVLYNGLTGEQLEANVFFGPVFYQRLKHMVNDKQHSRAIGPMVNLTRQPAEGRSRDGGFRIGEMERDVMLAHGMSRFCRERLYDASDKYSVHVCKRCGLIASYNDGTKNRMFSKDDFTIHLCKTCNNMTDFARVEIPYSYKLMAQELQAINVVPRLITE
jgi:DNA-directed RNA polymerase beta subunit/intein/homing endonuclease